MTTATAILPFTEENLHEMLESSKQPEWLTNLRRQAWEQASSLPFPTLKDERWRRTDPDRFQLKDGAPATINTDISALGDTSLPEGIVATTLARAVGSHGDALQKAYFKVLDPAADIFTAVNASFGSGGAFVSIPAEASVRSTPVRLDHQARAGFALPHTVIQAGEHSDSTVVEAFCSGDETSVAAPLVEIHLDPGSRLQYVHVHDWGSRTAVVPRIHAKLERDAELQILFVGLGGAITKAFLEADLVGRGARSECLGVVFTQGRQHFDCDVIQNHRMANTVSDVLFHMALTGRSRTIFAGNILVEPGAQQIDGYQTNRNLLLSRKARADSMPKLEIEANDVKCSHGATFASYDPAQEFYLQSRGLTRSEAEHLLITGFYQAVVDRLKHELMVEWLLSRLARKMESALGKS